MNTGGASGKRVLVVDDDPDTREILEEILTEEGYTVQGAASGERALRFCRSALLESQPPDLVILDFLLGDTNGARLLAQLREEKLLPDSTRVLLCAATDKFVSRAEEYGADDGLAKPFELADLLAKVEQLLFPVPAPLEQVSR